MSARILIVEDDHKIAALLRDYFEHAGYTTEAIHRGDEADAAILRFAPQLVILDLQLPGRDGLEICRALRARGPDPAIIMLTARVDEIDRLIGLELGADDYICKPFSPREVVARGRAVLRRLQPQAPGSNGAFVVGPLELDAAAHQVRVAGVPLTLTPIEFELLASFLAQPQRIWSRGQLLERVRGTDFSGYERNVDGHIKNLRRKLSERLDDRDPIRSVYGIGYGLDIDGLAP